MIDSLYGQILNALKLAGLDEDPRVLTAAADIVNICSAWSFQDGMQGGLFSNAELTLRAKVTSSSSKESQSVSQQLSDFGERLALVEAHLDELNDLLITAGIQDVQSSS